MVQQLHYPKELIAVEKEIASLPHLACCKGLPRRRLDIVCFAKGIHPEHSLYPLLVIECKGVVIAQKAIQQVIGYNAFVKARFIGLAAENAIQVGHFDASLGKYVFISHLPDFRELLRQ